MAHKPMKLKLNKARFARNRHREQDVGDVFNKASSGLTNMMPFLITLFFTPVIITTSMFSKEIILMFANISLSLGYISNFAYRAYRLEVSKSELFISSIVLVGFLAAAFFLYPTVGLLSIHSALGFINKMAAAVNLFFLIKDVIIPPVKQLIENIAQSVGFDIAGRYYTKPSLDLDRDLFVIKRLFRKHYQNDDITAADTQAKLNPLNKLLNKLSHYINKYDESIFGYIINKSVIADLETKITELTIEGNSDSSYAFIHKKIDFKRTKIQLLLSVKVRLLDAQKNSHTDIKPVLDFFINASRPLNATHREEILNACMSTLDEEITRQKNKILELELCLPIR